ncbi:MAG TPA: DUF433 domain-containing protein [Verrucomicrobiota bacterium]|nr:DUF433 domain-containing protein [Verrucomicrobiota bacterium]
MTAAETKTHIVLDERGVAWIDGANIKVIEVVLDHLAYGWSADAIHEQHPQLSLAEIHAALAYYYDHAPAFDEEIARQESELKTMRGTGQSPLQRRLRALAKSM